MRVAAGGVSPPRIRSQASNHLQSLRHVSRLHVQQACSFLILVRRQFPPAAFDQAESKRTLQTALFKLNQQGIPQIRRPHSGRVHFPQRRQRFIHIPHAETPLLFQLLRRLRQKPAFVQSVNQQEQGVPGAPRQCGMLRLVHQMGFQGFRSHDGFIHEITAGGRVPSAVNSFHPSSRSFQASPSGPSSSASGEASGNSSSMGLVSSA